MIMREIWILVKKEMLIELRMKYALSGMLFDFGEIKRFPIVK